MGLFDLFKKPNVADKAQVQAEEATSASRQQDILRSLRGGGVPAGTRSRLEGAGSGRLPWIATLTPAELLIARSHGIKPIASVSATCWLHYGYSWTNGHSEGWGTALRRLREEAQAAGANAVLDVKMRTIPLHVENGMDFTLVGTAVKVDGLPASTDPIIATVPALEFVKLLEADVVPTGIAIGAHYEWMTDWRGTAEQTWRGNVESRDLSNLWEVVRQRAHAQLRQSAGTQGNGVLAHVNFSQMFERELKDQPKQFLARHIVIATVVDAKSAGRPVDYIAKRYGLNTSVTTHVTVSNNGAMPLLPPGAMEAVLAAMDANGLGGLGDAIAIAGAGAASPAGSASATAIPHEFRMVVDMHQGKTPLSGTTRHHQSYATNARNGAI